MLHKVRTFLVIVLMGAFLSPFLSAPLEATVFEGKGIAEGSKLVEAELSDDISKADNFKKLVRGWINFTLSLVALLAVVVLVWAGAMFVTSLGEDSKRETAQKIIIYTVIGLIIIFAAFPIVNTLLQADLDPDSTRAPLPSVTENYA